MVSLLGSKNKSGKSAKETTLGIKMAFIPPEKGNLLGYKIQIFLQLQQNYFG